MDLQTGCLSVLAEDMLTQTMSLGPFITSKSSVGTTNEKNCVSQGMYNKIGVGGGRGRKGGGDVDGRFAN